MRIAVVAPSSRFSEEAAARVTALAARAPSRRRAPSSIRNASSPTTISPATDAERAAALVEVANDPGVRRGLVRARRLWLVPDRGGRARPVRRRRRGDKAWLGYSDAGFLLAGLYRAGFADVAHGPMPQDVMREGGEAAVARALGLARRRGPPARSSRGLEPAGATPRSTSPCSACCSARRSSPIWPTTCCCSRRFRSICTRSTGRCFTSPANPAVRRVAGIRLGRVSDVPPNDPDFGEDEETVARTWCERYGIPYLGRADIGHDSANKVVPFGLL